MTAQAKRVQRTYLLLMLLSTLASSLIWGVNTLFLLDAGLSNTAAFTANAFFTAGQVIFEVPTGIVADIWGRRTSFLLGALTLLLSTLLYLAMWHFAAPLWGWAIASVLIGLGFTFFSGATDAWLVDALTFTGFDGNLESVFAKGETVSGAAMLTGSVSTPMRQAYLNGIIPSAQRATVLSLDNLIGSAGGVVAQPALGRVADVSGYGASYVVSAAIHVAALPFLALARRENAPSDPIAALPSDSATPH